MIIDRTKLRDIDHALMGSMITKLIFNYLLPGSHSLPKLEQRSFAPFA